MMTFANHYIFSYYKLEFLTIISAQVKPNRILIVIKDYKIYLNGFRMQIIDEE